MKDSDSSGTFCRRFQKFKRRKHSHQKSRRHFQQQSLFRSQHPQCNEHTIINVTPKNQPLINNRSSAHADVQVHYNNSLAEQTIVDTTKKDRPIIKKKDNMHYPKTQ